jgi:DNA-binding GntR family transcriptional regulator
MSGKDGRSAAVERHGGRSVVDFVADALRAGVYEGRYAPGQRLIEADITAEYGVSRGTVRAALTQLEAEGIVGSINGRGSSVARLSRKAVADLFEVRAWLDGLAARLAAERIDAPGHRARLEEALKVWDRPDILANADVHMQENAVFHDLIRKLSGNSRLSKAVTQMQVPGYRIRFRLLLDGERLLRSRNEHVAIGRSILEGNARRAEALARAHGTFANTLLQSLPDWEFRT